MNETPTTAQRLESTSLFLTEGDCEAALAALDEAKALIEARVAAAATPAESTTNEPPTA